MSGETEIDELAARLEQAAERLRAGTLDAEEAAALIEECATLAARASGELERRMRGADAPSRAVPAGDQEPLTGPRQDSLL
jgi:class 3 adenylate cyclase